ncbi:type II toxin-antitoxin system HicB family antitoxin [Planctomicrobium sp. SH527]|uniref:type II toxin-antitoxin system HicB family antitoxin n=1 Tax=Planctomicrobium sp. SH527 TaxID=3448123 RepID=UPI003F5CB82C
MNTTMKVPLRVVFYYEEDAWVAHCLEFDLVGTGVSKSEALEMLAEAIETQAAYSFESGNLENLFKPADGKFLLMWARGRHVANGELRVHSISIDGVDAREFCDGLTA